MKQIKVGIVAPLEGRSAKMGAGLVDSARFILERRTGDLNARDIEIELVIKNDLSDPKRSLSLARELDKDDVICTIGPCDSLCAYEVLSVNDSHSPMITPLATATVLTRLGSSNFFRMTTPDNVRAEVLVRLAAKRFPNKCVQVYSFVDSPKGYSQQLKSDVIMALEKYQCMWRIEEFDAASFPARIPSGNEPAIFCSPSAETTKVIPILQDRGFRSQIFTFGSNSNLLSPNLVGTIVVADLDRSDTNATVREEIERFKTTYVSTDDPSISTMNCMSVIINYLLFQDDTIIRGTTDQARNLLITALRTTHQRGLFGPIAFTETGEMIGSELQLSVLRIAASKKLIQFSHLPSSEKRAIRSEASSFRSSPDKLESRQERHLTVGQNLSDKEHKSALLDIFISHSSEDRIIAEALINLLRAALSIPKERIRCTSVDGYRLPVGAWTGDRLRQEVNEATVFIGLITEASIRSAYVLFELGARWGAGLHLAPLLACGADSSLLHGPLADFNALSADIPAQINQLINDVSIALRIPPKRASAYQKQLNALYQESMSVRG